MMPGMETTNFTSSLYLVQNSISRAKIILRIGSKDPPSAKREIRIGNVVIQTFLYM